MGSHLTTETLERNLESRQGFWSRERLEGLEDRKREEIEFHNLDRAQGESVEKERTELDMHANRKWYSVTMPSRRYVQQWVDTHARGKVFLDYACGLGEVAIQAASAGATLSVGLDISDESIGLARAAAVQKGVEANCRFVQGDCEATEFPDSSFDTIICSGMLHHLDLDRAYAELRRILRPGGRILCVEALAHNPLIQLYRDRTPTMRTAWEAQHILGVPDALRARQWFAMGEMKFWHLFDLGSVPLRATPFGGAALGVGRVIDTVALRVPGLRRMAWQFTFELLHPSRK